MDLNKKSSNYELLVYSVAHFIVDFSCAFLMAEFVMGNVHGAGLLLIYNFCAFAMQLFIGVVADYIDKNAFVAALGCVFIALSGFWHLNPVAVVIISGLGNAMFHIGAGIDILNSDKSSSKIFPAGMFVSTGVLGIYLGKISGGKGYTYIIVTVLLLVTACLIILTAQYLGKLASSGNGGVSFNTESSLHYISAIMLSGVVVIRSYMGMVLVFPWKDTIVISGFLIALMTILGKCLGGVLADKAGYMGASVISLAGAAILFMFSSSFIPGILAVFLFQMTMPVTLWLLAKIFNRCKGFAFGILTFALFTGYYIDYRNLDIFLKGGAGYAVLSAISLLMMFAGIVTFYALKGKGHSV